MTELNKMFKNYKNEHVLGMLGLAVLLFALYKYSENKNVFKLSSLLFLSTKLKNYFNSKLVYFPILLSLFAPVTLVFTSFAGKDIIGIFLAFITVICLING